VCPDESLTLGCPALACRKQSQQKLDESLHQLELSNKKEIDIQIACRNFPNDPLPTNASIAYILEPSDTETIPDNSRSHNSNHNVEENQNFRPISTEPQEVVENTRSCITACRHTIVIFFLQQLRNPPKTGEIYKIKPPW